MKTTRRPPPQQRGNMYVEKYVHERELINDPVAFVHRNVESLATWLCKTGLLQRASRRELQHPPTLTTPRVAVAGRWYIRLVPCTDGERLRIEQLIKLETLAKAFAAAYAEKQVEQVAWLAFQIGELIERVHVLEYDRTVGTGKKIEIASAAGHAKTHGTPEEKKARWDSWQREINALIADGYQFSKAVEVVADKMNVHERTIRRHCPNPSARKS